MSRLSTAYDILNDDDDDYSLNTHRKIQNIQVVSTEQQFSSLEETTVISKWLETKIVLKRDHTIIGLWSVVPGDVFNVNRRKFFLLFILFFSFGFNGCIIYLLQERQWLDAFFDIILPDDPRVSTETDLVTRNFTFSLTIFVSFSLFILKYLIYLVLIHMYPYRVWNGKYFYLRRSFSILILLCFFVTAASFLLQGIIVVLQQSQNQLTALGSYILLSFLSFIIASFFDVIRIVFFYWCMRLCFCQKRSKDISYRCISHIHGIPMLGTKPRDPLTGQKFTRQQLRLYNKALSKRPWYIQLFSRPYPTNENSVPLIGGSDDELEDFEQNDHIGPESVL